MRFSWNGTSYLLEFERQHRMVNRGNVSFKSTYPYTTAKILKVTGPKADDREVVRSYTVGCSPYDHFNYEDGRKAALTLAMYDAPTKSGGAPLLGQRLTKEFRTAVWHAYHGRFDNQKA